MHAVTFLCCLVQYTLPPYVEAVLGHLDVATSAFVILSKFIDSLWSPGWKLNSALSTSFHGDGKEWLSP